MRTSKMTIDTFETGHNTFYLDKMTDNSYAIFRNEHELEKFGQTLRDLAKARFEFDKYRIINGLKVGNIYWIQSGHGTAFQVTLTHFNHNQTTGIFGTLPRKITSIYNTQEEAIQGEY